MPLQPGVFWSSALFASAVMFGFGLAVIALRQFAARREVFDDQAQLQLSWTAPRDLWRQYLRAKSGAYLNTLITWVALYALGMALFQGEGSFWQRALWFVLFAALLLVPPAVGLGLVAWFFPPTYGLSSRGIAAAVWVPILIRPGAGFLEGGFIPWSRIEEYRWEGDVLVFKGKRSLFSHGIVEVLVPPEHRRAVDQIVRERKLPRGSGPLLKLPSRSRREVRPSTSGSPAAPAAAGAHVDLPILRCV